MYCPACGASMPSAGIQVCEQCNWREPLPSVDDDPAIRMLIPVGRSGYAIAAGYFGLFSMIFFPAPIALMLGIVALRDIKQHPNKGGDSKWNAGDRQGAITASQNANKWTWIAFGCGIVANLLLVGVQVLAGLGAAAQQGGGF